MSTPAIRRRRYLAVTVTGLLVYAGSSMLLESENTSGAVTCWVLAPLLVWAGCIGYWMNWEGEPGTLATAIAMIAIACLSVCSCPFFFTGVFFLLCGYVIHTCKD